MYVDQHNLDSCDVGDELQQKVSSLEITNVAVPAARGVHEKTDAPITVQPMWFQRFRRG